jgi:glucose/arabinose dehydrogenase
MNHFYLYLILSMVTLGCNTAGLQNYNSSTTTGGDEPYFEKEKKEDVLKEEGAPRDLRLREIVMPPGFSLDVYATVPNARSLCLSPNGTLFVGTRKDKVYAVVDRDGNYKADEVIEIASGLNSPNGVAFRDGSLYVGEIHRIIRYDEIETNLKHALEPKVVYDKFPTEEHHGWKVIRFGPDGKIYAPIGAPCNICLRDEPIFSTITRLNPDGSGFEIFAHGVRNSVGYDWHPQSKQLWFTENGADRMGDNMPPDELNVAHKKGLHFGFPYCHAGTISDPEHGKGKKCEDFVSPVKKLGPHVAALGMRFNRGNMFPDIYKNQIFIAEHGSWDRSVPLGYRIMLVTLKGEKVVSYAPFAEGWLGKDGKAWGRPVDVEFMPDGSMLISDDGAGVIYRVSYNKPK